MKIVLAILMLLLVFTSTAPAFASAEKDRAALVTQQSKNTAYPLNYGPDSTVILVWVGILLLFILFPAPATVIPCIIITKGICK